MTRSIYARSRKNAFAIATAGVLVAAAGAVAMAAPAQAEAKTITESVYVSAQQGNQFLLPPQKVTVKSNEAENYGYTDQVNKNKGVSQLDVLVKAHELKYGKAFTKATATNYLNAPGGFISTAFKVTSYNWGIAADNASAVDSSSAYTSYGYTGLSVAQAPVAKNHAVNLFFYGDTTGWSDGFAYFAKSVKAKNGTTTNKYTKTVTARAGKKLKLNAQQLTLFMQNGAKNSADRASATKAFSGATLATVNKNGKLKTLKTNGKAVTTNKKGNATVTFKKKGTYVVSAKPAKGTYAASPWIIVKVK